jgi:hypothetical protein
MNAQRRSFSHHRGGGSSRPNVAQIEMGDSTTNLFCFSGMNDGVVEQEPHDEGVVISPRLSPAMAMALDEGQHSPTSSSSSTSSSRRSFFFGRTKKSPPSRGVETSMSFQTCTKDIKLPSLGVSSSSSSNSSTKKTHLKAPPPEPTKKLSSTSPLRSDRTNEDPALGCDIPPQKYDRNADWQQRMIQEWESRPPSCTTTSSTLTATTATATSTIASSHRSSNQHKPQQRQRKEEMDQFENKTNSTALLADIVRPRPMTSSSRVPPTESSCRGASDDDDDDDDFEDFDDSEDSGYSDAPSDIEVNPWTKVSAEYLALPPRMPARTISERGVGIVGHQQEQLKKKKNTEEEEESTPFPIEMIEVKPGIAVPLKGCEETWKAFCRGKVTETECSSCQTFLYCVATATVVLCPCCHFLSHVGGNDDEGQQHSDEGEGEGGDVGIGLTVEDVSQRMSGIHNSKKSTGTF